MILQRMCFSTLLHIRRNGLPMDKQCPLEYAHGVVGGVLSVLCP